MTSFATFFPELAQREGRCVHIGPSATPNQTLPADQYCYLEFYCEAPNCDCRRVFRQVRGKNQADKILASINYGWELPLRIPEH